MPFKSKAQRRKFAELLLKGEISEEAYERWNRETGSALLPEHAASKRRRTSKPKKAGTVSRSASKSKHRSASGSRRKRAA